MNDEAPECLTVLSKTLNCSPPLTDMKYDEMAYLLGVVLSMTLNCSSLSDEGDLSGCLYDWGRCCSRCGLGWASARKPRAPSQEPSKRFGVWDPHENPGHRPNDRNPSRLCLQNPTTSDTRKKKPDGSKKLPVWLKKFSVQTDMVQCASQTSLVSCARCAPVRSCTRVQVEFYSCLFHAVWIHSHLPHAWVKVCVQSSDG